MAGVTREVLDREQVDKPQVDLADAGMCPDVVEAGFDPETTATGSAKSPG